jgi:Transcriptional Coactivator p15 (PC4)
MQQPASRPSLREPIEIGKFFKNRAGDIIAVQLKEYEGVPFVDVRQFFTGDDGVTRPTKKGVTVVVRKLPELAAAINKALERARAIGLLDEGDTP